MIPNHFAHRISTLKSEKSNSDSRFLFPVSSQLTSESDVSVTPKYLQCGQFPNVTADH